MSDTWARKKSRRAARRRAVILSSRFLAFGAIALSTLAIVSYLLFPAEQVRVEGDRMLPESEILQNVPERTSLPMISARRLQNDVDSNPWVKGVSVNKNWRSDTVIVEVEERNPVLNAKLGSGEQVVVAEDGTRLPGLGGISLPEVELDRTGLDEVQGVQRTLDGGGVEVESVNSVGARGVEVSVQRSDGPGAQALVSEEIGAGQVRVLDNLLRERVDARQFDLRTPERVIVSGGSAGGSTGDSSNSG